MPRTTALLLNAAHALDHLFLLIFAAAIGAIAVDFGIARWEDLMPYTTGAFLMFGLASVPAGRWGDLWGRRPMMLVFFFGMGLSALAVAATQTPWQMAVALTVLGAFSAIYHPVGIPMLVQNSATPGRAIGFNGLAGNLGIALAAVSTGFLVKHFGWRMAFVVPGVVSLLLGLWFARVAPAETRVPGRKPATQVHLPRHLAVRTFIVMVASATTGSLLFNLTTNGNAQLLAQRLDGLVRDPALLGALLGGIYALASLAQVVVGRLLDRVAVKPLFLGVVLLQVLMFALAAVSSGWLWYACAVAYMVAIFAAIPFNDTMIVRYIDDSMRSRVSGVRLAISFSISSLAVYSLGPLVKNAGFTTLMLAMAVIAAFTALIVTALPGQAQMQAGAATVR
ncbi:MAG: MFS transporter [Rhodoferax sp.]|nr:MFS transporter [Rhodoferax sp.]